MRKILLPVFAIFLLPAVYAQQTQPDEFNLSKKAITRKSMLVLGGISVINIVYNTAAVTTNTGTTKYFNEMNIIWGGINLGLAALGYLGARNEAGSTFATTLKKQSGIEKTFLVNAGLDIAYITGGLYLKESAKNSIKNHDKLKGYGESVLLQGSMLFVFDVAMSAIHSRHGKKLYKMAEKIQLSATGNGIGLLVKL